MSDFHLTSFLLGWTAAMTVVVIVRWWRDR
jgi:hypothetical protein